MAGIKWTEFPYVRVAICFSIGISIGQFVYPSLYFSSIALLVLLVYYLIVELTAKAVLLRTHVVTSLVFLAIFIMSGMMRFSIEDNQLNQNAQFFNKEQSYLVSGKIVEKMKSSYGYKYVLSAELVNDTAGVHKLNQLLVITFKPEDTAAIYMLSDQVQFHARPKPILSPKNPSGFDYSYFLRTKGIVTQFAILPGHHRNYDLTSSRTLSDIPLRYRDQASIILAKYIIDDQSRAVAESLLTGSRTNLSNQTSAVFVNTGAMHVLAVSGLHVGIFIGFFVFLFNRIKTKKKIYRYFKLLFLLIIIVFYVLFTGASPSVVRAGIMIGLVLTSKEFFKKSNSYNVLSVTALGMLIYQPFLLFQASFQFSFMALISILYFQPIFGKLWFPKYKFTKYFWSLATVTLAAQILIFPISVYYFHQFPIVFLFSSFIAIPLAFGIILLGSAMIFLDPYFSGLSFYISKILNPILDFLINALTMLGGSEYSLMRDVYFSKISLVFGLLFCVTLMIWILNRNYAIFLTMLASFIIFIGEYQYSKISSRSKSLLTIYDQYRGFTIDGFLGNTSTCYYSGDLDTANVHNMTFVHRLNHFINKVNYQSIDSSGFIQIGPTKVYHLKNRTDYLRINGKQAVDYLIVNTSLRPEKILALFQKIDPKVIILPRGLYPKSKSSWLLELKRYSFPIYDIESSGALVHAK